MNIKNNLLYREFVQRESSSIRAPYNPELEFYNSIKNGDTKKIRQLSSETFSDKVGLGVLSENNLQSLKYHFAITTALVARYCIEGGMNYSEAYTLSDFYILTADKCTTVADISSLHRDMCLDYTTKMKQLKTQKIYSFHILKCLDFIYDNLHTRITLDILSSHAGISNAYLSRLFKEETGMAVSEYIQHQKIETAKRMLIYSDYSISEIASILAFPSHSYFSEIFKAHTTLTPSEYKKNNSRALIT